MSLAKVLEKRMKQLEPVRQNTLFEGVTLLMRLRSTTPMYMVTFNEGDAIDEECDRTTNSEEAS